MQKGLGRGWVEFLQGRACSKYKRVREPLIAVLQELACVAPRRLLLAAACAGRLVAQVRSAGLLRCSWCGLLVYRPAQRVSTQDDLIWTLPCYCPCWTSTSDMQAGTS